jgi:hypothetical protein
MATITKTVAAYDPEQAKQAMIEDLEYAFQ